MKFCKQTFTIQFKAVRIADFMLRNNVSSQYSEQIYTVTLPVIIQYYAQLNLMPADSTFLEFSKIVYLG